MSEKPSIQTAAGSTYPGYHQSRLPYTGTAYQQFNTGKSGSFFWFKSTYSSLIGLNLSNPSPLSSMQNLKANLAASTNYESELGAANRQGYNSPLMMLPSGQTVPLTGFYGPNQSSTGDVSAHLPYVPTGMFPNFVGNTTLGTSTLPAWHYGMATNVSGFDPSRRGSWSSNEENDSHTQAIAMTGQADYYTGLPLLPATLSGQHYIAGPIQPMKCQDNKSYEMANLDELVTRDPPLPRAVPALWTNQEELSLAKCLQNPEGITNVYIRGFMPDTTDEDLERWASRFGEIESCKAIIEQDTGKCKG